MAEGFFFGFCFFHVKEKREAQAAETHVTPVIKKKKKELKTDKTIKICTAKKCYQFSLINKTEKCLRKLSKQGTKTESRGRLETGNNYRLDRKH